MRLAVTGKEGQLARALAELGTELGVEEVCLGRPCLDLAEPDTIFPALAAARPDVVVNAAAYTAVDAAETDSASAFAVNATGAGAVAAGADRLGVPVVHISTDYVFDGSKPSPYVEEDPTSPAGVYGASKLAGEKAVAQANPKHAILRTAWVYSAGGKNFVRTMLTLAENRNQLRVVADQQGCPTYAPDLARAVLAVAAKLSQRPAETDGRYGTFHAAGAGETTWAGFATEIFRLAGERGRPVPTVVPIPSTAYPTPARRPANSRLHCGRLARVHEVALPDWRESLPICVERLLATQDTQTFTRPSR